MLLRAMPRPAKKAKRAAQTAAATAARAARDAAADDDPQQTLTQMMRAGAAAGAPAEVALSPADVGVPLDRPVEEHGTCSCVESIADVFGSCAAAWILCHSFVCTCRWTVVCKRCHRLQNRHAVMPVDRPEMRCLRVYRRRTALAERASSAGRCLFLDVSRQECFSVSLCAV